MTDFAAKMEGTAGTSLVQPPLHMCWVAPVQTLAPAGKPSDNYAECSLSLSPSCADTLAWKGQNKAPDSCSIAESTEGKLERIKKHRLQHHRERHQARKEPAQNGGDITRTYDYGEDIFRVCV